jgi:large repetitive protein
MNLSSIARRQQGRTSIRLVSVLALVLALGLVLVPSASALRFTDGSYLVPVGTVGEYYAHEFIGDGGCGLPYQFRVLSGALPPGLSLTGDGLLVGIPTQAGSWSFWLELSDEDPPSEPWCLPKKSQRRFTVDVVAALVITTGSAAPATLGTPYSLRLSAQGGSGTRTWSIASGALPPGLTLNSSSGEISGSPTAAGVYEFRVRVSDGVRLGSKQFTLPVREPLAAYARTVPPAEASIPIAPVKVAATGGSASRTWRLEGSLPRGLSFDTRDATITGTPQVAGIFTVKLVVSDGEGRTDDVRLTLVVSPKLALARKSLATASIGRRYRARITASGGVGATTFKLVSGRLPAGIGLKATGTLIGSPRTPGANHFVIELRDKLGASARRGYVLTVR